MLTLKPNRTDWIALTVRPQANSRKGKLLGAFWAYTLVKEKGWLQSCTRIEHALEFLQITVITRGSPEYGSA